MKKLYEVRQERTERVAWVTKFWADSPEEALGLGEEHKNDPGAYLDDRTLATLETKPMTAHEVTDPNILRAWRTGFDDEP